MIVNKIKVINIDNNVFPFPIIDDNRVIYRNAENRILSIDLINDSVLFSEENVKFYSIKEWGNYIIDNSLKYVDKETLSLKGDISELINDNGNSVFEFSLDKKTILARYVNSEKGIVNFYLVDVFKKDIQKLNLDFPKFSYNNSLICLSAKNTKPQKLYSYSFVDKREQWQINLHGLLGREEVEFGHNSYVVYQNKLFFYLKEKIKSRKAIRELSQQLGYPYQPAQMGYSVDLETGKVLSEYPNFRGGDYYHFGNKMGIGGRDAAKILDFETNQVRIYDPAPIIESHNIRIQNYNNIFTDDNLWFFVGHRLGLGSHIGIIDLEKMELLWLHNLSSSEEVYEVSANKIKLVGNKLYVLCSGNQLRIYEIERNSSI